MTNLTEFITELPNFIGIFMLMLSTFLIGYFSGSFLQKSKSKSLIARLKKEVNDSILDKQVNDIETIFTEIKPKIMQVVKEARNDYKEPQSPKKVAENAHTSYVSYAKSKPDLNFESFGYGDKNRKDELTQIGGIGPYIEEKLNEIGIYNFEQIGRFSEADIRVVTELIDFFPGRIDRDDWIGQANALKTH